MGDGAALRIADGNNLKQWFSRGEGDLLSGGVAEPYDFSPFGYRLPALG